MTREGDDLGSGRVVSAFTVLGAVSGSGAQVRAFSAYAVDAPELAVRVNFTNGGQEILRIAVP